MFLNTFTAHAPILAKKWVVLPLKRKLLLKSRVTQRQLNLLYVRIWHSTDPSPQHPLATFSL